MIQPFQPVEIALKDVIEQWYPGQVGGDMSFEAGEGLYIQIAQVDGSTDATTGEWVFDVDIYADSYGQAQAAALDIEARLLTPGGKTGGGMILDRFYQSMAARPMPWDDENVTRLGAIYGFTSRRSG